MASVCLNMIVRDEARVIDRCLASVRPFIDSWLVVDTGSVDDTPARVAAALAGLPGALHHCPWRNFGHNRSEALELARDKADYLLFIDADEVLGAGADAALPALGEPAYALEVRYGSLSYERLSLASTALPWRWRGVLHEYLDAGTRVAQPRLPGFWVDVYPEGARSRDPEKYQKDAAVLEAALRDEPDNARYVFYLAQSYRDAGNRAAALAHYERRAGMGGWEEEAWFARYQAAAMMEALGLPSAHVQAAYLAAWEMRPGRAEPLLALARHLRLRQRWHGAWLFASQAMEIPRPEDRLFVEIAAYGWRRRDELALASFYTGRRDDARRLWHELLDGDELPAGERQRIRDNLSYLA